MAERRNPVKPVYSGTDAIALGEYAPGDTMAMPGVIEAATAGGAAAYMEGFGAQYAAFGSATNTPTVIATNKTEVARFTQAGDFGVGTNAPIVRGDFRGDNYTAVRTYTVTNGVDARLQTVGAESKGCVGTVSNHPFALVTNNQEWATITPAGRVGINTTAPSSTFDVNGTATVGDSTTSLAMYRDERGDFISVEAFQYNNSPVKRGIAFCGYGRGWVGIGATSPVDTQGGSAMLSLQSSKASNDCAMYITGFGDGYGVGIRSKLVPTAANNAGWHSQFYDWGGISVGGIYSSGSSTSFATSSDYRLKENVAPMQNALATVAALKPCTYTWKSNGSEGQGFIAHELQAVVPDCVTGEKDAMQTVDDFDEKGVKIGTKEVPIYQGVDTSFLVATLVAAIQELTAKVTALETAAKQPTSTTEN